MVPEAKLKGLVLGFTSHVYWSRDDKRVRRLYLSLPQSCIYHSNSFDSSMMNGLQAVDSWDTCSFCFEGKVDAIN